MDLSQYKIKLNNNPDINTCHLCYLAERKKRVTHTSDGRYKSHSKWKCTLPPHAKCPLNDNEYYSE